MKPTTKTSPERLNPHDQNVPDDPVRLPPDGGWHACRSCGIAVQTSDEAELIQVETVGEEIEGAAALLRANADRPRTPLFFTLCADCQRTAELAEKLTEGNKWPSASGLLSCALDALSFVAPQMISSGEAAALDQASQASLVRHLAQLGAQARWQSRFVPVIVGDADPQTCSRYRFAHIKVGARAELRTA